ncbi:5,10-methenyltetrahydrofolate synthetase [Capsaspora owczarzaki ATCC 30864]|uniref:5-formyltetrahydrofolate cyclo-ligase n=1 Tax=Capsaspora owczarzaki (strain ATCC 30864) TaxID=595528 RepID=A0A0D2U9K9_CAPO3|nr:5,10-methenyltetrahydrofolate synthetase [Capsaspora owczarzaki ATCC 30864]KJE91766.1 5,10-methenyltetrahydrofolate synthetase [Capsaspora owczarzaki ATCC 30864]|eukprot:XP_004363695.1 5,10-methenyltetrahydrofolate synthetase [Capsaspora owczarzaki ATCC 30864]
MSLQLKSLVRKELRARLRAMDTATRAAESKRIVTQVLTQCERYKQAKHVAMFLSMPSEVDTAELLADSLKAGKTVYVPRYEADTMDFLRVYSLRDIATLPRNEMNIAQPEYHVSQSVLTPEATEVEMASPAEAAGGASVTTTSETTAPTTAPTTATTAHSNTTTTNTTPSIKESAETVARENPLDNGKLDLILVPGLGFTAAGDRIGRGKGYYDKYLTRIFTTFAANGWTAPATIALTFPCQIMDSIPTDATDVRIGHVLF